MNGSNYKYDFITFMCQALIEIRGMHDIHEKNGPFLHWKLFIEREKGKQESTINFLYANTLLKVPGTKWSILINNFMKIHKVRHLDKVLRKISL